MDAKEEIKDVISEVIAEPKFSARGVLWLTLSIFWKNPLLYLSIACITAIPAIALALLTDLKFGMRVGAYAGGALWMVFVKPIAYTVYKEILGERVRIGEAIRKASPSASWSGSSNRPVCGAEARNKNGAREMLPRPGVCA